MSCDQQEHRHRLLQKTANTDTGIDPCDSVTKVRRHPTSKYSGFTSPGHYSGDAADSFYQDANKVTNGCVSEQILRCVHDLPHNLGPVACHGAVVDRRELLRLLSGIVLSGIVLFGIVLSDRPHR